MTFNSSIQSYKWKRFNAKVQERMSLNFSNSFCSIPSRVFFFSSIFHSFIHGHDTDVKIQSEKLEKELFWNGKSDATCVFV